MRILLYITISISFIFAQLVESGHPRAHETIHPQMNDYCRTCHSCNNPSAEEPCLINCPRHGAEFSDAHIFEEGPNIVVIDKLSNLYGPVVFAHELHASMSDMSGGCTLCHHYAEKSGEIPACSKCHLDKFDIKTIDEPSLKGAYHRQCLGCHREWSHENACQFCHKEIDEPIVLSETTDPSDIVGSFHPLIEAQESYIYQTDYKDGKIVTFHHTDHVDVFGLNCADCHKGDNCCHCHDTEKEQAETCMVEHVETCCKCHMESNCSFCHSEKVKPKFNHDTSTNFRLGHFHADVDCNRCHSSVKDFRIPSTNCLFCHDGWIVGDFDHVIAGLTLSDDHSEEDCESCHIDNDFSVEPTCDNCHDEITYPDYSPEE